MWHVHGQMLLTFLSWLHSPPSFQKAHCSNGARSGQLGAGLIDRHHFGGWCTTCLGHSVTASPSYMGSAISSLSSTSSPSSWSETGSVASRWLECLPEKSTSVCDQQSGTRIVRRQVKYKWNLLESLMFEQCCFSKCLLIFWKQAINKCRSRVLSQLVRKNYAMF